MAKTYEYLLPYAGISNGAYRLPGNHYRVAAGTFLYGYGAFAERQPGRPALRSLHGAPVRNLYLVTTDSTKTATKIAEGGINNDLSWSPDSRKIYYSRKVRDQSSSLVNDIFMTDRITGKETRLTYGRRARYPVPGPGNQIAYVVNENGTGNIFLMDLETGTEERLTRYTGDVQLITPAWNSAQNSWIFQRFNPHGERHVVVVDADSKEEVVIDGRGFDNRNFIVSPDGMHIAYHSLRNEVPNVFTLDFRTGEESRVTNLFTGGEV